MLINKIRAVATKIRLFYEREHPDNPDLDSLCHEASSDLAKELRKHHFAAKIYSGLYVWWDKTYEKYRKCDHRWVQVGNLIIDITATQFLAKEKILITNHPDKRYSRHSRKNIFSDYVNRFLKR